MHDCISYLPSLSSTQTLVIETHPESLTDLRLDCPFPALHDFAASFDLDSLDSLDHGHVPFVVVLLKYLDQWRTEVSDYGARVDFCFAEWL